MQIGKLMLALLALVPGAVLCPSAAAADEVPLTNEAFVDLQKRMLTLSELEWKDRVAIAEEWQRQLLEVRKNVEATRGSTHSTRDGENVLATRMHANLEQASARYRSYRSTLLGNFQTSNLAFTRFGRENKHGLEEYLKGNSAVQSEIDSLRSRVDGLIQRFESITVALRQGGQK